MPAPESAAAGKRPRATLVRLALQRRMFLTGASATALLAANALSAMAADDRKIYDPARGMPFDDGTWFDDGYGWVD